MDKMARGRNQTRTEANSSVAGDDRPMRFVRVGDMAPSNAHDEGADTSHDAINRIVGISGATKSDPAFEDMATDPTFGEAPGDAAEDAREEA